MKRNHLRFSLITFLMGGVIVLSLSGAAPNRFASAGQRNGGEVIAKPTPAPNRPAEKSKSIPN